MVGCHQRRLAAVRTISRLLVTVLAKVEDESCLQFVEDDVIGMALAIGPAFGDIERDAVL